MIQTLRIPVGCRGRWQEQYVAERGGLLRWGKGKAKLVFSETPATSRFSRALRKRTSQRCINNTSCNLSHFTSPLLYTTHQC